jgi:hypothetical protein
MANFVERNRDPTTAAVCIISLVVQLRLYTLHFRSPQGGSSSTGETLIEATASRFQG